MRTITLRITPAVVLILVARLAARQEKPAPLQDNRAARAIRSLTKKEQLGKELFLDKNLSTPPGQACAHCHAAEAGFGQPDADVPVSQGVHPDRFGNRNDMTAAYERTHELNPFSSKYDLFLQGKVKLTDQEQRGLALFEDEKKGRCVECHPNRPGPNREPPLFTDFTYDNLGVPKNAESPFYYLPRSLNPDGTKFVDLGLGGVVKKPEESGKFRVPTLRNVAVTAPYMHNGIFKRLRQVVAFYNTRDVGPWPAPEVPQNVNREELGNLGLTEQEVDDIVVFLHTLTDGYEAGVDSR